MGADADLRSALSFCQHGPARPLRLNSTHLPEAPLCTHLRRHRLGNNHHHNNIYTVAVIITVIIIIIYIITPSSLSPRLSSDPVLLLVP